MTIQKLSVFSHPDFTVGCGISPHQLALADFKRNLFYDASLAHLDIV